MLRIDDTDLARSEERFVEAIRVDLAWFGLAVDREERQSQRFELYEHEFQRLRDAGRVYACYETPEELDLRRKVLLGRGLPPVYERKAADASVPEGVSPHWRFKLDYDEPLAWTDLIRGPQAFDPAKISDPVIRRADGSWLYLLPSVIDDVDLGITTVVRGEDHVSNTAVQLQMFSALGATGRALRTKHCSQAPKANCRSALAASIAMRCAKKGSNRSRSPRCSRISGPAIRSSR